VSHFFVSILRALNIPSAYLYGIGGSGHGVPVFHTIGHTLSHGDDVYSVKFNIPTLDPDYLPPEKILVPNWLFDLWFHPPGPVASKNVARQVFEIALEVLPNAIMDRYCTDQQSIYHPSQGAVYDTFDHLYSFEELQAMGLWKRLEQKRQKLNYCVNYW
jgi:hypothetical protein